MARRSLVISADSRRPEDWDAGSRQAVGEIAGDVNCSRLPEATGQ